MPTFCRHNRMTQNCPICREPEPPASRAPRPRRASAGTKRAGRHAVVVRTAARVTDDGHRSGVTPGIKLSADAERLAQELAFAAGRLDQLATAPPGLYAEVGSEPDLEEATWLALLIAYLCPLDDPDPFGGVRAVRTAWADDRLPTIEDTVLGPRSSHAAARGASGPGAYRAWAQRFGSQEAALTGDPSWSPERRFERAFERLALPGMRRAARFDFLLTLGTLGRYPLAPGALLLGGDDQTTLAAKRVFAIGDTAQLERRARALATACDLPLGVLDLGLFNWQQTAAGQPRAALGASDRADTHVERCRAVLGLAP